MSAIWLAAAASVLAVSATAAFIAVDMPSGARAPDHAARLCRTDRGMPDGFGRSRAAGMIRVPEGAVRLGSRGGYPDEAPSGEAVRVDAFWMDRTEVTNAQFAEFVNATGYTTQAEREGAAAVFRAQSVAASARPSPWWVWLKGANWRLPEGPGRTPARPNEPVVMVTYQDALAYAHWLGHDLPTEAEWEYAAQGGGSAEKIGREPRDAKGRPVANYWQGVFPDINTKEDGYAAVAPVGCYRRNGYGLADMIGNVWELTRDRYTGPHQAHGNGDTSDAVDAAGAVPRAGESMVIKGGSFLCAQNYCLRYRVSARHAHESDMPTSHVGFRTVLRERPKNGDNR
ncbi:MAG: formylglycine-generating enzyme family protein [Burkholderiaceae bacterium]|nr:formylglycine-generating enzyme family protein [Burkholderiaceae bacterium]